MASATETVTVNLSAEAVEQFDKFVNSLADTMRKADEWYRDQMNLRDLVREEVRSALLGHQIEPGLRLKPLKAQESDEPGCSYEIVAYATSTSTDRLVGRLVARGGGWDLSAEANWREWALVDPKTGEPTKLPIYVPTVADALAIMEAARREFFDGLFETEPSA